VTGFCEHDDESSVTVKGGEFLTHVVSVRIISTVYWNLVRGNA
jgi:hypothetical protein